ncbi:hypothetical protein [Niabella hibiscisoli]|uniref:hypothetical protein n=1 Tax=Niabella hibiscisoli TaxID=1825928 RepID=UPI001F0F08E6|nr:hypothetical protein [Niabella hibiscisoli]MCH5720419.1 hypothetical protein [Niabella hibiscisoli]
MILVPLTVKLFPSIVKLPAPEPTRNDLPFAEVSLGGVVVVSLGGVVVVVSLGGVVVVESPPVYMGEDFVHEELDCTNRAVQKHMPKHFREL